VILFAAVQQLGAQVLPHVMSMPPAADDQQGLDRLAEAPIQGASGTQEDPKRTEGVQDGASFATLTRGDLG
jgi:hypothetical protein